jgi:hypothetical protein
LTKDTQGVPGLCEIPDSILKKIEAADAVVVDLTFIAKTAGKNPKHCPNPNVLFELGYAFHAIGPERLICVMNEAHGSVEGVLFDIAHRRYPVRYTSPASGQTKKQITTSLAQAIANALRPTVLLGPRSMGVDNDREFQRESDQIFAQWGEAPSDIKDWPSVLFSLRPIRYQKRRWPDPDSLEELLRQHTVVSFSGSGYVPPNDRGTDVMPWGLFNERYGSPAWALCYSGQFWARIGIGAWNEYVRTGRDLSLHTYDEEDEGNVPPGRWINYPYARTDIADIFRFAGSFARAFHPGEQLVWSATAERLNRTIVATTNFASVFTCSRECASATAHSDGVVTSETFADQWTEYCIEFLNEMFGMFDFLGDRIPRQAFEKWLNDLLTARQRHC